MVSKRHLIAGLRRENLGSATAQLARFHDERSREYRAIAELIQLPPTLARRSDVAHYLAEEPWPYEARTPRSELIAALHAPRASGAPAELRTLRRRGVVQFECPDPARAVGTTVAAAIDLAAPRCKYDELRVMSELARQTAQAITSHDMALADQLVASQVRFLEDHAADCLLDFAVTLQRQTTSSFYARVGRALAALVADDQDVFRPTSTHRPAPPA